MVGRGQVKAENFRTIWESQPFPTSSFAYAHDLAPELAKKVTQCFYDFRFPDEMKKSIGGGDDRFVPVTYEKEWAPVRFVADKVNAPYNRAAYDAESKRELEAEAKKKAEKEQKKQ